jgi:hypothetical protein
MFALTFLFTIGSIFSVNTIIKYNKQEKVQLSTVAHADWPEKDFDELINEADVIAIVQVKKQKIKEDTIGEGHFLERHYSDLVVKKILKGNPDAEIVLNQAVDYIEKNEKYLVFLKEGDDGYYYELTDDAIVPYKEGKYISKIKDLTNDFKEEEIINKIDKKTKGL